MEGQTVGVVGKIQMVAITNRSEPIPLTLYLLPKLLFQETIRLPWQDAWILVLLRRRLVLSDFAMPSIFLL
jgi:hypothetical protein